MWVDGVIVTQITYDNALHKTPAICLPRLGIGLYYRTGAVIYNPSRKSAHSLFLYVLINPYAFDAS